MQHRLHKMIYILFLHNKADVKNVSIHTTFVHFKVISNVNSSYLLYNSRKLNNKE